jgi:DNA-binding NarL/FixJ family response regulator
MLDNTRVLIVHDAGMMRDALCGLLRTLEGLTVVTAVGNDADALPSVSSESPDVAIVDFALGNGLSSVAAVRSRWPAIRILALTSNCDQRVIQLALRAGVEGCISKYDSCADLGAAITTLVRGIQHLGPSIRAAIDRHVASGAEPSEGKSAAAALTDREREVMKCIAAGYRTREIAEQLSLSHKTVEKHRTNLMRKLGLRTAAAVAAFAIANGHIDV